MNWNMFGGPRQQGLRMGQPRGLPAGDMFSANPMARSGINLPSVDNFRVPMPVQASTGLQMPPQMPGAIVPAQQGFQVPQGLATQMNAPLQPNLSAGMSPMAIMQLMNMGMKINDQGQSQQQPMQPAFRMPTPDLAPYRRFSLFGR